MLTGVIQKDFYPIEFLIKKHFCSICGEKLKVSKNINYYKPNTDEFRKNKPNGMGTLGDLKVITYDFKCENCNRHIKAEEQFDIEKKIREEKKQIKKDKS